VFHGRSLSAERMIKIGSLTRRIDQVDRKARVDADQHAAAQHAVDDYPNEGFHGNAFKNLRFAGNLKSECRGLKTSMRRLTSYQPNGKEQS
jgi:hypothetical protein